MRGLGFDVWALESAEPRWRRVTQYASPPLHSHGDRSTHVVPGTGTSFFCFFFGITAWSLVTLKWGLSGGPWEISASRFQGPRGYPALPCSLLLHEQTRKKEEIHGMSLEINPKTNRFGRFGRLKRRGVGERKKSPPRSGSSSESSNYDTLETALSLDTSAYAPLHGKP